MAKTLIDIDDELLAHAMAATASSTKKQTVHAALEQVVRRAEARAYIERLEAGQGRDLDEPEVISAAQR